MPHGQNVSVCSLFYTYHRAYSYSINTVEWIHICHNHNKWHWLRTFYLTGSIWIFILWNLIFRTALWFWYNYGWDIDRWLTSPKSQDCKEYNWMFNLDSLTPDTIFYATLPTLHSVCLNKQTEQKKRGSSQDYTERILIFLVEIMLVSQCLYKLF